jgi:MarR family transcriptional regulator, lower aerobic nicotinate degradation pathway regulator
VIGDEDHRTPHRLQGTAFWLLGRATRLAQQLTQASLAEAGMRRGFYGVLASLEEFGPAAQADIGRRLAIDPSDIVDILNDLEHAGYLRREQDPADRRRNIVRMTPAGGRALEHFDAAIAAAEDTLLARFTPAERARLLRSLQRLAGPPEPGAATPEPGAATAQPRAAAPKARVAAPKPRAAAPHPKASTSRSREPAPPADGGFPPGIPAPATRALTGAGYTALSQLAGVPAAELRKLHGMGPKALRLLQEALERHGLSLG